MKRTVLVGLALAVAVPATASAVSLSTFVGEWGGHTRGLTISHKGRGVETIGDGCCDEIIDLTFRVSRPRAGAHGALATITVTSVKVHDKSAFTKAHPAPHVGSVGTLRLAHHVLHESLTRTIYCDETSGMRGTCGA